MQSQNQISLKARLAAALLSLIVFMAATELALIPFEDTLYYEHSFFPMKGDLDFYKVFEKDSDRIWKFRPNSTTKSRLYDNLTYHYNSMGLRDDELDGNGNNLLAIAVGNSCTFGWGINYEDIWPTRLEKLLNEMPSKNKWEVLNAGIPGYSSYQGKVYLEKELLNLNPDIVIIMFGWNDHWTAVRGKPDHMQKMPPRLLLDFQNLLSSTNLYKLFRKLYLIGLNENKGTLINDKSSNLRVPPEIFYENLKEMIDLIREKDTEPLILIPPVASAENYFDGRTLPLHSLHLNYQKQIQRAADYKQVRVINLQEIFDKRSDLFDNATLDPVHFNEKGHDLVARLIFQQLEPVFVGK